MSCAKQAAAVQQSLDVERIRQHPGQQQVDRAVKVDVPGKHFPQLQQVCCAVATTVGLSRAGLSRAGLSRASE